MFGFIARMHQCHKEEKLRIAALKCDAEKVIKYVQQQRVDINAQDCSKKSVLHAAVIGGDVNIIKYLIKHGATIDAEDIQGVTPLLYAICIGSAACYDVNNDEYVKHSLEKRADIEVVRALLEMGAKVNTQQKQYKKSTPLHYAVSFNRTDIIELLLDHGALVNAVDFKQNITPLQLALAQGHVDAAKLLLRRGADPTVRIENHPTALHFACVKGIADLISPLLKAGAVLTETDEAGENALHHAARGFVSEKHEVPDAHKQVAVELLKEANISLGMEEKRKFINARNAFGKSPLDLALKSCNEALAKTLLKHGACPNKADSIWIWLDLPAQWGAKELESLLLEDCPDFPILR